MADAHITGEGTHIAGTKHIAHQAFVFVHVEGAAFCGDDTRRVLATMLQHRQAIVKQLVNGAL